MNRNTAKKFVAAILSLVMVISVITVNPVQADTTGTVTFTIERMTIGQGFFVQPTQVAIQEDDTVQSVFYKIMELNSGTVTLAGTYIKSIANADNGSLNIPQEIALMNNSISTYYDAEGHEYYTAYYAPNNDRNDGNPNAPALGEGAYNSMAGWMFTINNQSATASMDEIKVKDGDVIRLQFSIYGWGADLGHDTEEWTGIAPLKLESKDELLKAVAAVNANKTYWMAYPNVQKAYTDANTILLKYNPTFEELATSLEALRAAQETPTYPPVAKATISSIKNVKGRKAKITVKKLSGVTGYQYKYSKKKKLTKATTKTTTKSSITTKKFKKVINKKTKKVKKTVCYARIRAYKKVNGVRVYGTWSARKSVKIKK